MPPDSSNVTAAYSALVEMLPEVSEVIRIEKLRSG